MLPFRSLLRASTQLRLLGATARSTSASESEAQAVPLRPRKHAKEWNAGMGLQGAKRKAFVDWMQVKIVAGSGGDGKVSVLSIYANEFAGKLL